MTGEDVIRDRLDDPDIEIISVDSDGKGNYADITVTGTKRKLRRLVREHFDVDGAIESAEGTTARVRPKW
jgi:hypothetical protein